jgi:predicted RNA binding protein YcfA (HicA-like mRNA interferase family)
MSKVPSLSYQEIITALKRDNWKFIRQNGSHIHLEKILDHETLKITVPAHRPVKRSTLSHILKQARISVEDFLKLL